MSYKIISILLAVISLIYLPFIHQLCAPSVLSAADYHGGTLNNLTTILFAGLVAGLGFMHSGISAYTVKSRTLILGAAIPVLLLLPSIIEFTKLGFVLSTPFLVTLICMSFYYAVIALRLGRLALTIVVTAAIMGSISEFWYAFSALNLSNEAADNIALRTVIIGTMAIFFANNYVKNHIILTLIILAIGAAETCILQNLGSTCAIAAWTTTMIISTLGSSASKIKGRFIVTSAMFLAIVGGFIALTGASSSPVIDSQMLSFCFSSFYSSGFTGHGYDTLAQASILHDVMGTKGPSLLACTLYETGISGLLALALACWLFLRNSLKAGESLLSCLTRTATIVPFIIGTVCAANITSDLFILMTAVGLAAFLERTSGCLEIIPRKSNFLKFQLAWIIPLTISAFCITGIFSLSSTENFISSYNNKSIDSAFTLYNAKLPQLSEEFIPLFSVLQLNERSKIQNYNKIFATNNTTNKRYISNNSRYSTLTNNLLSSLSINSNSLIFNPFPEYKRFVEAENKFNAFSSVTNHMPLLGLESYENIITRLTTSTDPDLMYAAATICKNLELSIPPKKVELLLGDAQDFKLCALKYTTLQQKIYQPEDHKSFTSRLLKFQKILDN